MDEELFHHLLIAEKSTHKLYLYEVAPIPKLIKTYAMASGKNQGNKINSGDSKTPEGIYFFTKFLSSADIIKMYGKYGETYGVGAFVTNYPNPFDTVQRKTGGGIWIHSTNDESRIEKGLDSKGCVVVANDDLKDISRYLELGKTGMVIVDHLYFLPEAIWNTNLNEVQQFLDEWLAAWQNKNDDYFNFYDQNHFFDSFRGDFVKFKSYKRRIFNSPDNFQVSISNVAFIQMSGQVVISFIQKYTSSVVDDSGIKTLYLQRDRNYKWKIIRELWSKRDLTPSPMIPSMRFFKDNE